MYRARTDSFLKARNAASSRAGPPQTGLKQGKSKLTYRQGVKGVNWCSVLRRDSRSADALRSRVSRRAEPTHERVPLVDEDRAYRPVLSARPSSILPHSWENLRALAVISEPPGGQGGSKCFGLPSPLGGAGKPR